MPRPILHRRDHEHGGADTVRIVWESVGTGGSGGGIQFDTYPQAGQWLYIETDGPDESPSGYGIEMFDTSGHGIDLSSNGGILLHNTADGDVAITNAAGQVLISSADSDGVHLSASAGPIVIASSVADIDISAGGNIIMPLSTADPHVYGALYLTGANVVTMSGG